MRSKILLTIFVLAIALTVPALAGTAGTDDYTDTSIRIYDCPSTLQAGEYLQAMTHLTYANGSEITVNYMDYLTVDQHLNGKTLHGMTLCNATGHSGFSTRIDTPGIIELTVSFRGSNHRELAPCVSQTYLVNVYSKDTETGSGSYMLDLISYAKGFFAISFFGTLFGAVGLGCVSVLSNDPQKKAASQARLLYIGKILLTVTLLFLAVLFVAP